MGLAMLNHKQLFFPGADRMQHCQRPGAEGLLCGGLHTVLIVLWSGKGSEGGSCLRVPTLESEHECRSAGCCCVSKVGASHGFECFPCHAGRMLMLAVLSWVICGGHR